MPPLRCPVALVAALACTTILAPRTSAAAPKVLNKKRAIPTKKPTPVTTPKPVPAPTDVGACTAVRTIQFKDKAFRLPLVVGPRTGLAGELDVNAYLRFSKTRVFLKGAARLRRTSRGRELVRNRASFSFAEQVAVPDDCEIASVTPKSGTAVLLPDGDGYQRLYGTDLIDTMECQVGREPSCRDLTTTAIEVRMRKRRPECDGQRLDVPPIEIARTNRIAGDSAMTGKPYVEVRGSVFSRPNGKVYAVATLMVEEPGNDRSKVFGSKKVELFDVTADAPGCRLVPFRHAGQIRTRGGPLEKTGAVPTSAAEQQLNHTAEGILKPSICTISTRRNDEAAIACGAVNFRDPYITLEPIPPSQAR
ncbi:MAG: hypothetical protein AAF721_16725 [Myxococcota bacterium]